MKRGVLRVYLGASPGVGKTFAMLCEGRRRRDRGTDVVVAFVETHGRENTAEQVGDLEVLARTPIAHRGTSFEEMDLDFVLGRAPEVALVDELAHTNAPGSRNQKRWQDIEELLNAGIDVISTVNVQHLESLNDVVETITGVRQLETVPDHIVRSADQIELVDMTPEALRRRMVHGNIYAGDKIDAALGNYFRPGNLAALRELALLWVANRVDETVLQYRTENAIAGPWETRERIVVAITGSPSSEVLIRRAGRIAQRSHGELLGVHVRSDDGRYRAPTAQLEQNRQLLEDIGGRYHELVSADIEEALLDFATAENATQLVLGASHRSRLAELTQGSVINDLIRRAGPVDVHVISTKPEHQTDRSQRVRSRDRGGAVLPRRRRQTGWILSVTGPAASTAALAASRDTFGQGTQYVLLQAIVLACAAIGGIGPALTSAMLGTLALNWYFTEPLYTLSVNDVENAVALVAFTTTGVAVGLLVTILARRSADARQLRREAEALARIAAGLVTSDDPLPSMLDRISALLALDDLTVTTGNTVIATTGDDTRDPDSVIIDLLDGGQLIATGSVTDDDRRLLAAFGNQVNAVLDRRRLAAESADVAKLEEADAFRTAILRAVSHDLRTPLASVKAAVTSLEQDDVAWTDEDEADFLATIHEETDRLDALIANLLDASRIEAGILRPRRDRVALEDVAAAALTSLGGVDKGRVRLNVDHGLPYVEADLGLLERVLANLIMNAVAASPPDRQVQVRARISPAPATVILEVTDHGPGVAQEERARMFEPFQRLGDTHTTAGIGLGLAVAHGLVAAMRGTLVPSTTPGGGLTMTITLPISNA